MIIKQMKRVLVIVEGQTEEEFVKSVLAPYLQAEDIYITPIIVITKKNKSGANFKGGLQNYNQLKRDIEKALKDVSVIVTTFIDLYALPNDFPNYGECKKKIAPLEKVECLEGAMAENINHPRFIPYIQLHEFEALLFSSSDGFKSFLSHENKLIEEVSKIIQFFPNPEDINDKPETAPSKRIISAYPSYDKVFEGGMIALENGIEVVLEKCPHFLNWVERLKTQSKT